MLIPRGRDQVWSVAGPNKLVSATPIEVHPVCVGQQRSTNIFCIILFAPTRQCDMVDAIVTIWFATIPKQLYL